jgi:tRNA A-37 threonylcarbamoyl transferase component Bud32
MEPSTGPQSHAAPDNKAPEADSAGDLTGQSLGDFHILRRLGEGGMGQVYLAEQKSLNRKVALKLLRAELAANTISLARFEAEAKAVAQATHANIVQVYAFGEINGLHYMALEYVEGRNLRQYLEKKGPPELMLALSIIRQVAAALQRASELGIIHRDIKPENILLTRKGEVKVADFGLSRLFGDDRQALNLTQSGVTMGTPLYMSPEQVEGKPVDPRTDIYSFGVTCYHLLTGNPPFRGSTPFDVAVQHVQKQPEPIANIRPDLPPELCNLVHKMMAKNPDDRVQTGREIVRELMRLRDNLVSGNSGQHTYVVQMGPGAPDAQYDAALTQSLPQPPRSPMRWLLWPAVGTVLLALIASLAYGWWQAHDRPDQAQQPPPPGADQVLDVPPVPGKAAPALDKDEQFLLDGITKHTKDKNFQLAMKYRVDLGVHYLNAWRLDDADKVFIALEGQQELKPKYFNRFGHLGRALVLAFRDQYKESNKHILEVLGKPPLKDAVYPIWLNHKELSEIVSRALDHNYANSPDTFPPALQKYRSPPPPKIKT